MGLYNTYGKDEIQFKAASTDDLICKVFKEGEICDLDDGLYLSPYGAVAVIEGRCFSFYDHDIKDTMGRSFRSL